MKANVEREVIEELWDPKGVRKLARELAEIAAEAVTLTGGPVRQPGAEQRPLSEVPRGNRIWSDWCGMCGKPAWLCRIRDMALSR